MIITTKQIEEAWESGRCDEGFNLQMQYGKQERRRRQQWRKCFEAALHWATAELAAQEADRAVALEEERFGREE